MLQVSRPETVPVSLIAATGFFICRRPAIKLAAEYVFPVSIELPQTTKTFGQCANDSGGSAKSRNRSGRQSAPPSVPPTQSLLGSATLSHLLRTSPHRPPIERRSQFNPLTPV